MEYENKLNICITDIFWDRVFLNIIIEGENLEEEEIYLSSKSYKYKLQLDKISDGKYQTKMNITNIEDGQMLTNGDYTVKIKYENEEGEEKYKLIEIDANTGYKLDNLDKVYRYYKEFYAYTINFTIKPMKNGLITFILKSRYMKINKKPKQHCRMSKKKSMENKLKNLMKNIFEIVLEGMYKFFSLIHFNKKNKILLMSETRSPISGNLKALDERLKERGLDKTYKISYSFYKTLETRYVKLSIKWIKLIWLISKQSFIFIDDYSPLFKFINLDKKTKLIQVWHAGVGFKSVGYARFGFAGPEPFNSCHRKYDYAIVGSTNLIPVYEEVFGISKEKILPYGLPRLDGYLDKDRIESTKEKVYNTYPELKSKKIILFAPTFRGEGQRKAYYPYSQIDLEKIFELCNKKDYMFLIKMHPFIKKEIEIPEEYQEKIKNVSSYPEINDLLYITDILITDYSSNIYDYSLLNRPIILYTFDLDKYQLTNKIQRKVEPYSPGKVCRTFEELIETIENEDFMLDKLKKYREDNFDDINANSSDLIIDNIILKEETEEDTTE